MSSLLNRASRSCRRSGWPCSRWSCSDKLERSSANATEPIAIVGIGCRFPGGVATREAFWRLLREGGDAVARCRADRWDVDAFYDPDPDAPGKMSTRWGGFLDARRPLRCAVLRHLAARGRQHGPAAAAAARGRLGGARSTPGSRPTRCAAAATGVFVGICTSDYYGMLRRAGDPTRIDAYSRTGNAAQRRVGPAVLRARPAGPEHRRSTPPARRRWSRCTWPARACAAASADLALAGGVNLILLARHHDRASRRSRMLAPDGRCKTFDARADGYRARRGLRRGRAEAAVRRAWPTATASSR